MVSKVRIVFINLHIALSISCHFDDADFGVGEAVELVNELVDLPVGGLVVFHRWL